MEGDSPPSREDATTDVGDSMPVSRLAGLRGRFSSWRRKRKSIPAVAVVADADDDDDEVDSVESGVDSNESITAAAAASWAKPAVPHDSGAETASAGQAEPRTSARRSDKVANPPGEKIGVAAAAMTPTAENVLVTDEPVAPREALPPVADSVAVEGGEASCKKKRPLTSVGALAVSVADDSGAANGAAVLPANHPRGAASLEKEPGARVVTAADQSTAAPAGNGGQPLAEEIEIADEQRQFPVLSSVNGPSSSGGASSGREGRARGDTARPGGTSIGGDRGDYLNGKRNGPPSSRPVSTIPPSEGIASTVTTSRVATDSNTKDGLLGGADASTPPKNDRPSSAGNPGESAASAAVGDAKETVETSTAPPAAWSTAKRPAAAEAVTLGSSERSDPVIPPSSASLSSPVPTRTAISPRSPRSPSSRKQASRAREGSGSNLATERKRPEASTKVEEREGSADEAGLAVSAGKPTLPAKAADDETAAPAGEAVPRAAGKASEVGGGGGGEGGGRGSDTLEGPSSAWDAMNPAAEFLKDWVDKAVPQKKAELKRREGTICWERQWCVTFGDCWYSQYRCRFGILWAGTHSSLSFLYSSFAFLSAHARRGLWRGG